MNSSDQTDQIDVAIVTAREAMGNVPKSRKHFSGYMYASLEDYMVVVDAAMASAALFVVSEAGGVVPCERHTKTGDPQHGCYVTLTMRVIHSVSGQWREITCPGEGQAGDDKGVYKAITGARKYALALFWDLLTVDDPEANGASGKLPDVGGYENTSAQAGDGIPF